VLPPNKVIYRYASISQNIWYRVYATLVFVFIIDEAESELAVLDLIQVLVEVLDKSFENVCELDLIFNPDKLNYIIDEIVVDGMVTETNITEIVTAL
jgi:AP-3 complex subunit sigma